MTHWKLRCSVVMFGSNQQASSKQAASKQPGKAGQQAGKQAAGRQVQASAGSSSQAANAPFPGARPQNKEIIKIISCGSAKIKLFPHARPPDTTLTCWYDLALALVSKHMSVTLWHIYTENRSWGKPRARTPFFPPPSDSAVGRAAPLPWHGALLRWSDGPCWTWRPGMVQPMGDEENDPLVN